MKEGPDILVFFKQLYCPFKYSLTYLTLIRLHGMFPSLLTTKAYQVCQVKLFTGASMTFLTLHMMLPRTPQPAHSRYQFIHAD